MDKQLSIDIDWFIQLSNTIDNMQTNIELVSTQINELKQACENLTILQSVQLEEIRNLKTTLSYVSSNTDLLQSQLKSIDAKSNDTNISLSNLEDRIQTCEANTTSILDSVHYIQEAFELKNNNQVRIHSSNNSSFI